MKGKYLTEKERYLIEAWLLDKVPVKEIAKRLGIPDEHVAIIENMSDYEKEIYLDVDHKYFKTYFKC